jgi:aspartyl-tRNA(Asn)/glutamyl-tRNA(Gln) amidotransferase subunit C
MSQNLFKNGLCSILMDIEINEDLIKQVARNSCLELSKEEIAAFVNDFKDILQHFETLAEAPVAESPSFHPVSVKDNYREDEGGKCLTHEEAMQNVKEESDGYIRGPKVI